MADNPKQAEALKQSIQHWKENSEAKTPEEAAVGRSDCALCTLYNPAFDHEYLERCSGLPVLERCAGCPVHDQTGMKFCQGTPFDAAENLFESWKYQPDNEKLGVQFRKAARREYKYLLNLKKP